MAKHRASRILLSAQPFFRRCGLRRGPWLAGLRPRNNRAMFSPGYRVGRHRKNSAVQRLGLLAAALLLSGTAPGQDEGGSHWRMYPLTAAQGGTFAVAVTVSPRGNVWVRQGGDGPVSWLDGFQVRTIPFSGTNNFPVYESRSGQIWALFAGGGV